MYDTNMIERFKAESVVLQKMKEMHTHVQAIFCDKSIGSRFHLNVSITFSYPLKISHYKYSFSSPLTNMYLENGTWTAQVGKRFLNITRTIRITMAAKSLTDRSMFTLTLVEVLKEPNSVVWPCAESLALPITTRGNSTVGGITPD